VRRPQANPSERFTKKIGKFFKMYCFQNNRKWPESLPKVEEWLNHTMANFRDYKYANNKSKFAQHLLDNRHSIGPKENVMDVIYTTAKGKMFNTNEKFYIYRETRNNNQINDKCTVTPNIIPDTVILKDVDRVLVIL
jgi:hypothetical protein